MVDNSNEALDLIERLKKDFKQTFGKEEGQRVLEHLKEVAGYHKPCMFKEQHLFIQQVALGFLIDHIYTMLEQPKEVIYNLLAGSKK